MQGVKNVITKCHKLNIKQTKSTPLPLKKQNNTNLFIIFKKHLKHISMAYKVTANQNISLLKSTIFFYILVYESLIIHPPRIQGGMH